MGSETGTRVAVAVIGIPITVGLIYLGGWALAVLLGVAAVLAAREFYAMAERTVARPLRLLGCGVAAGFVVLAALDPAAGPRQAGFALTSAVSAAQSGAAALVPPTAVHSWFA